MIVSFCVLYVDPVFSCILQLSVLVEDMPLTEECKHKKVSLEV